MKKLINLIQKYKIILGSLLLGISLTMQAMEPENPNRVTTPNWKALFAQLDKTKKSANKDPQRMASLDRLRRSGQAKMGEWQRSASPQFASESDEPTPQTVQCARVVQFNGCIQALATIPFTTKIIVGIQNKLHRIDACDRTTQTIELSQPIAGLIASGDGSLCAVLLMPKKDCFPEIRCMNACKSTLELNKDIEPIPYYRTNDYEIGQEADFSSDACYLATISSANSVCIHNLSHNSPHAVIMKKEHEFPVFSVHFLKKTGNSADPGKQSLLAVQSNLETTVHSVNDAGCQELYRINHQQRNSPDYSPRQAAWILPDLLVVRIGKKLLVYNAKKELVHTFTVGKNSTLNPCGISNNFIECRKKEKKIRVHNLNDFNAIELPCQTNKETLIDESSRIYALVHNNELVLVLKPQQDETKKE